MNTVNGIKVIECRGTPYEIGKQWGEGCRDELIKSLEKNLDDISIAYQAQKGLVIENALKFLPLVEKYDTYLIEILRGQADGAGMAFEEIFALRCMLELNIYYGKIGGLCTSFAVSGKATLDGKTILGQNVDWSSGTPMVLLKIHHNNGLSQLALSIGGFVEYTLTSKGYGMCANATFGSEYSQNLPLGCYLPKVMRQNSLEEAMNILRQVARGLGYYHLADGKGQLMGIESVHDDYEVMLPDNDTLVHSNHYLTERFKETDMVHMVIPDSLHRVVRIKSLLDRHYGQITPQVMMTILADHENMPDAICRHPDDTKPEPMRSETLASFVMVPEDGIMYIANGNPCKVEYLKYTL